MENQITIKNQGIKWGLILGLMTTIVSLLVNIFELYGNDTAIQIVSSVLVIAALIFALQEYKGAHEGFMSLGEGFGLSMLILTISTLFSSFISYLYMKFVDSAMIEKIKEIQITQLEEQGMSDEQIDNFMEMSEFMMTPEMLTIAGIFSYLFLGAILALIIAAILKKNRPVEF